MRLDSVLDTRKLPKEHDQVVWPGGITWKTLRPSKKITEFASMESRAMGLSPGDVTYDKIIVKWKSVNVLRQITLDGFHLPILLEDGTVDLRHYHVMTA